MDPKPSQTYTMMLAGAVMILAALWLFAISMTEIVPFPPETTMEFVIIIFVILGMNFGISSGKKLAYTIHDRDIIMSHIQGQSHGRITTMIGTIMKMPIMFTVVTTIIWILFIIVLTLFRSMLVDTVIIGTVRWMMVIAMMLIISGSFLFYRARSYGKTHMLTLKGKIIMGMNGRVMDGAMRGIDRVEEEGRNIINEAEYAGKDIVHRAEDAGWEMVDRVDEKGKDIANRLWKKL